MLPADRIPGWTNVRRRRFLRAFLDDFAAYRADVTYVAFPFRPVEGEGARRIRESLEVRIARCRRVVGAAGLGSLVRQVPAERPGGVNRVDLLAACFHLDRHTLRPDDLIEVLQGAVRAYERGARGAWLRTANPLYWVDMALAVVETLPFVPLGWIGLAPARAARSLPGRTVRYAVRCATLLVLAWGALLAAGLLDEAYRVGEAALRGVTGAAWSRD